MKEELETSSAADASNQAIEKFTYIPWIGSEDVTTPSLATYIRRYMSYLTQESKGMVRQAIFVDSTSAQDGAVLIAEWKRPLLGTEEYRKNYSEDSKTMIIRWGRVETRTAQSMCTSLEMANLRWEEVYAKDGSEVSLPQAERKELARLGKPLAEAGVWDDG